MPTYIVGDIHISDPASYQAHLPRALATIARFGGRAQVAARSIFGRRSDAGTDLCHRISDRRCGPTMVSVR
jgi:hypothetical protein